ncbi:MAG: ATP-binding protein [Bryobacteraceae bacterium]|jgi:DNA replication protein DnaC
MGASDIEFLRFSDHGHYVSGSGGIGKSHIIQAVGQKACVHGYRVLYRTSAQIMSDLTASLADKTLPARLRRYASPDLLIIDVFGFDRIERIECPEAAHLLYKIIAARNQKPQRKTQSTPSKPQPGRRPSRSQAPRRPERDPHAGPLPPARMA